ncbi:STAS domain-containing protein [Alkalimonas amylolytica]|uniref:Anti-anti-sigma factor n=1 Tax=Alkalimonas amylolytica TaxID=152573 RepID=A0A1H4B7C4_ALKAM|nr:STAS domain-containing protein [Alkalimonas amylolytica]SEA44093.1 anti-anti-sigma factor [Alkalimonas amylolytica]
MSDEQILFACLQDHCYFKLTGELRYTNAIGMDDLIEQLFEQEQPACAQVVVDLNEASFIDSTHIGLLASLARHCQQHQLPKPVLFSTNAEINQLLKGLCLERVFDFIEHPTNQAIDLTPVQTGQPSDQDKGEMILRAHEALLDLSDTNRQEFKPVVDLLRKQLQDD